MFNPVPIEWVVGGCVSVLIFAVAYSFLGQKQDPYFARQTLLTQTELKFYKILSQICKKSLSGLPFSLEIAPQVRLADIINCTERNWQKGYGPQISSKHIDFVLFDPHTADIKLCIELDDPSHDQAHRQRRDIFVNKALVAARVPLIRILVKDMYNQKLIVGNIKKNIL